ncbi:MAG TPA: hypothetical protein VF808_06295 [Ktedonobacterales bacterium]
MSHASTVSPVEEVATFFARGPSPEDIARFHLSKGAQKLIERLLDKEDDGTLSIEDKRQLDELLILNDLVALIRAQVPRSVT